MLPGWCCIANRHIGARERRQLIPPHVRFQVPFLGPESQLKSGFACAGLLCSENCYSSWTVLFLPPFYNRPVKAVCQLTHPGVQRVSHGLRLISEVPQSSHALKVRPTNSMKKERAQSTYKRIWDHATAYQLLSCGHVHEDCTNACQFRLPASICEDEYRSFFKRTVESSGAGSLEHLNCTVTEGRHILDALTRG